MKSYRSTFLFVAVVFGLAIILRILLFNWVLHFWNNGDFTRYEDWARIAHVYSFADTYTTKHLSVSIIYPNNQPPGSLYILSGTYETYILVGKLIAKLTHTSAGSILWVNIFLQHILMRMPVILADLFMGILAYLLVVKEKGRKYALLSASLILFNPVVWYNSTIWGQMDALNNLFFLLSLFLAFQKRYIFSILSFAISLYIKLSLLPILPFYFVFLFFLSNKKIKPLLIGLSISILGVLLATFPISHNPIAWLNTELPIIARGELQNITVAAFNFWWFITCGPFSCPGIPVISAKFLGITLQQWGYFLFATTTLPLLYLQIKKSKYLTTKHNALLLFALIALLSFLFLPTMHDRYMYPVFPLLAVVVGLSKPIRTYLIIFCILSLLHFSNLVYSWYPTYFPVFVIYQIIYSNIFRWSVSALTLGVTVWFYKKSIWEFIKAH